MQVNKTKLSCFFSLQPLFGKDGCQIWIVTNIFQVGRYENQILKNEHRIKYNIKLF